MKDRLDKSTAYIIDLTDQPTSAGVLLVQGLYGDRQAFAVDGLTCTEFSVRGWIGTDNQGSIVVLPPHSKWTFVNRAVLKIQPLRDSLRQQLLDNKAIDEYHQQVLTEEGIIAPQDLSAAPPTTRTPELFGHYI